MAKKEEKKQPETTEELIPEETPEAPQEEPKAAEAPETSANHCIRSRSM